MIKKILSTLLVSSVLFVFAATSSFAERPTINDRLATATYGGYDSKLVLEFEGSVEHHKR